MFSGRTPYPSQCVSHGVGACPSTPYEPMDLWHHAEYHLLCGFTHRLRINGCGIFDVLSFDASNSPNAMIPHFQVNLLDGMVETELRFRVNFL